jgi:outer membrane protein OmpA-like peptidoglycan-associated protein
MGSTQNAIASGFVFLVLSAFVGTTSASAGAAPGAPFALAQIDVAPEAGTSPPTPPAATDPVSVAEKAVEDARAALRQAMATGGDVRSARRDLQAAIQHLNQVRETAESGEKPPQDDNSEATAEAPSDLPAQTATEAPVAPPSPADPNEPPPLASPAAPTPAVAAPPPLPAPGAPVTTADQPATSPPETASDEAATNEAKPEEKPGFFGRLFGSGSEPGQADSEAPKSSETAEDINEPSLPIFRKLPPVSGPKVVAVAPGEAEVAKEDDDKRMIVREGSRLTVKHDDNDRFRRKGEEIAVEKGQGGTTITTVTRDNGTEVVTVRDAGGDIVQRYRKKKSGEVEMLIGDRDRDGKPRKAPGATSISPGSDRRADFSKSLPRLVISIPANQYVVGSQAASRSQIEQTLSAPPIEAIERPYALEEIRRSQRLRAKLRRIDIDTVNFEFGAATIAEDQIPNLQVIGNALADIIADDPNEVFYIEGHTDAVGSNLSNLALSDKRAESIAEILTFYFNIPPENLVTQGYGEQYLKVLTAGPERQNRRASVRRITPLLVGQPLAAAQ